MINEDGKQIPVTRPEILEPTDRRPSRVETTVQRLVRDTKQSQEIKKLYDYKCQMCAERLTTSLGGYAEGAHIRPLGAPHNGTDSFDNLLCRCPNHHVLFDLGAIGINDDLSLIGRLGKVIIQAPNQS